MGRLLFSGRAHKAKQKASATNNLIIPSDKPTLLVGQLRSFFPHRASAAFFAICFLRAFGNFAGPFGTFAFPPFRPISARYSLIAFRFFISRTISRLKKECNKPLFLLVYFKPLEAQ